ncbi:hypothetical protein H1C71_013536 [Ictidomys tridecemlineatus]|nr:hypothetical protein H1C71_013536 [Ictidomys tridecemlineatus]
MQHTKLPGGNKCSVQVFMSDSSVYLGLLFRNIPTFLVTIEFQREMCSLFKMTQACVLTPSLILSLTAIPLQLLSLCLDFTRCIFKEPTNMSLANRIHSGCPSVKHAGSLLKKGNCTQHKKIVLGMQSVFKVVFFILCYDFIFLFSKVTIW